MAGLRQESGEQVTYAKLYMKEPGTDTVNAFIGVSKKVDGKWVLSERYNTIEGILDSVELGEFIHKEESHTTVKFMILDDEGGKIQLEGTMTSLVRGLINTLSSASLDVPVNIKLYVNKNGSAATYVTQNSEAISWKFSWEVVPKMKEYPLPNNKVHKDFTDMDNFFKEAATELGLACKEAKLKRQGSAPAYQAQNAAALPVAANLPAGTGIAPPPNGKANPKAGAMQQQNPPRAGEAGFTDGDKPKSNALEVMRQAGMAQEVNPVSPEAAGFFTKEEDNDLPF